MNRNGANHLGTFPRQRFFSEFRPVLPYRSNFSGKNIWLKYKVFDAIFYADSEYLVYFALESTFNGQNVKNSEKL